MYPGRNIYAKTVFVSVHSTQLHQTMIGFKTLDVGQQALVYSLGGRARVVTGPERLFLWREKFILLTAYSANQNEYVVVNHKNGKVEHLQGPVAIFKNPLIHNHIRVEKCQSLSANEVLVVYSQDPESQFVRRYVKHGPTIFMPDANEWLHEFRWHGADPDNKTKMVPGNLVFTKLQVIPDQFYYNVPEVRTADDALIRVKLMLFYELKNIEQMLNATQDPMADFINCLEADVVTFASNLTYIEFIDQSAQLNELSNYPQLMERCKAIGYEVTKVVFRGYLASPVLQQMHDSTIMARNQLKIAYETAEQEQEITDANLKNEIERVKLEQEMEIEQLTHKQEIEKLEQEHQLQMSKEEAVEEVKTYTAKENHALEATKAKSHQRLQHLEKLHEMSVDVNRYVLSETSTPAKLTRIVNTTEGTNVHLHQKEE